MKPYFFLIIFSVSFLLFQCNTGAERKEKDKLKVLPFDPAGLSVKSSGKFEKARGQLLYLPLYSNIPYSEKRGEYDLSGFLTIHNTDLKKELRITHIYYFNNNGELMKDFLGKDSLLLRPLQSQSFFIPEKDKSGTGANFLVEWKTDSLVNIPLIETVMVSLKGGQGVSFLSTGKVLEQLD